MTLYSGRPVVEGMEKSSRKGGEKQQERQGGMIAAGRGTLEINTECFHTCGHHEDSLCGSHL